jgi:hypothetical protein
MVLRSKPRNRCGDFETQVSKPKLSVLRHKLGNPPPPWFWGSTKKPIVGFEVKPGETIATSFEAKQEKIIATGFEAKPVKTIATDFGGQTAKNRRRWFWGQTGENRPSGFEAKPLTNCRPWYWGSTKKLALLVSTCTVETAHDATRPLNCPATEYLTCAIIPGPLHQVSYSCHGPRRCTPCRTCHLHITRQVNLILQAKKVKEKQNKIVPDSNSNLVKSMTHHNQTKERTTWFLNLPLDESIDNKSTKFEVWIQDPTKHS